MDPEVENYVVLRTRKTEILNNMKIKEEVEKSNIDNLLST